MKDQEDIPADVSELIRLGTIASVTLKPPRCTVDYGDEEDGEGAAVTPPIRWLMPRAGDTQVWSPPTVGEQVVLLVPDGQIAAAVALLGLTQDAFPPGWSSLTEGVKFKDGARISYDPEGHALLAELPAGATAAIIATGGIRITGAVTIEGTVTVTGDVVADGISLKDHRHKDVQAGTAVSGPPA